MRDDHDKSLARALSKAWCAIFDTELAPIYQLLDQANQFPKSARPMLDTARFFIDMAKEGHDTLDMQLARRLNDCLAQVKANLLALEADGTDISECRELLKLAGHELLQTPQLPRPNALPELRRAVRKVRKQVKKQGGTAHAR